MTEDDHKGFLELFDKYQKARREVERIIREHVISGPRITPSNPVASVDSADRCRRIKDAELEEPTVQGRVARILPDVVILRTSVFAYTP